MTAFLEFNAEFAFFHWPTQLIVRLVSFLEKVFLHFIQPSCHSLRIGAAADLTRRNGERITENALLRQELIVLHRQIKERTLSVALIQPMAWENRLWGAERICGELLRLGVTVAQPILQTDPCPCGEADLTNPHDRLKTSHQRHLGLQRFAHH